MLLEEALTLGSSLGLIDSFYENLITGDMLYRRYLAFELSADDHNWICCS